MDFTSQPYRGSSRQIDEKDGPPKIKIFDADIAYQKFTWDGRDPRHLVAIYKPADLTMEEFVGWWYKKVSPRLQNGKHSLYIVAMDQLHHNGKNVPAVAIKCTATEKSVDLDKYFAELRERQKAHNV
ncbi:uncharacterized protein KY384_000111 [Bacidia gigantensis]|uniref:uncharacterized protein n=1 Tax=Bacidia gigantensis TaxID=2732470 RepID=UPI001D05220D|nr:uncharacterized protein KY384_000111 [Bacidia gigantensis]KAG8526118.1 hypothetical protein KY384_000111 [Bacidia gigantensis]